MFQITGTVKDFGIYIHWPFCLSKCPYCDFNSHVRSSIDTEVWEKALLTELQYVHQQTKDKVVSSIFFGGGTPSLMAPKTVAAIIDAVSKYWQTAELEITLEANPNSVETQRMQDFKHAGVNRVSLGVQSFDDKSLKFLGRGHNSDEAIKAIETAQSLFERYSFDLIYALPDQNLGAWEQELKQALQYAQSHVSLYQLTIEPGTAFHTRFHRSEFCLPSEDNAAALYEKTTEIMLQAGLYNYEVSNYAKPGHECKHNLVYWRYNDYAGIGPGAHGRITIDGQKVATKCFKAPEIWLDAVQKQQHGIQELQPVNNNDRAVEMLMMGLRLEEGINLARFKQEVGCDVEDVLNNQALTSLTKAGFLQLDDQIIRATAAGRLRLNAVLEKLF